MATVSTGSGDGRSPAAKVPRTEYSLAEQLYSAAGLADSLPALPSTSAATALLAWLGHNHGAEHVAPKQESDQIIALEQQVSKFVAAVERLVLMQMASMKQPEPTPAPASAQAFPAGQPDRSQEGGHSRDAEMGVAATSSKVAEIVNKFQGAEKLPGDLLASMRSESAKFGKLLRTLGRSRAMVAKLEDRLSELRSGKLPAGCKPWKPRLLARPPAACPLSKLQHGP